MESNITRREEWRDFFGFDYKPEPPDRKDQIDRLVKTVLNLLKTNFLKLGKWLPKLKKVKWHWVVAILFFVLFFTLPRTIQASRVDAPSTPTSVSTPKPTQTAVPEKTSILDAPQQFVPLIVKASRDTGVPDTLIAALIKWESNYNPNANGDGGQSWGLGQIYIPMHPNITPQQAQDPAFAIPWIAGHLKAKYDKFGTWYNALQAYNGGDGAVYYSYSHNYADSICRSAGLY